MREAGGELVERLELVLAQDDVGPGGGGVGERARKGLAGRRRGSLFGRGMQSVGHLVPASAGKRMRSQSAVIRLRSRVDLEGMPAWEDLSGTPATRGSATCAEPYHRFRRSRMFRGSTGVDVTTAAPATIAVGPRASARPRHDDRPRHRRLKPRLRRPRVAAPRRPGGLVPGDRLHRRVGAARRRRPGDGARAARARGVRRARRHDRRHHDGAGDTAPPATTTVEAPPRRRPRATDQAGGAERHRPPGRRRARGRRGRGLGYVGVTAGNAPTTTEPNTVYYRQGQEAPPSGWRPTCRSNQVTALPASGGLAAAVPAGAQVALVIGPG